MFSFIQLNCSRHVVQERAL